MQDARLGLHPHMQHDIDLFEFVYNAVLQSRMALVACDGLLINITAINSTRICCGRLSAP